MTLHNIVRASGSELALGALQMVLLLLLLLLLKTNLRTVQFPLNFGCRPCLDPDLRII